MCINRNNDLNIRINENNVENQRPILSGLELLGLADMSSDHNYLVFGKQDNGIMHQIHNDDKIDLTKINSRNFLVIEEKAGNYQLLIDGKEHMWPVKLITGIMIKYLSGVDPNIFELWKVNQNEIDKKIKNEELINLEKVKNDRFYTVISTTTAGEISEISNILPSKDKYYLEKYNISFEIVFSSQQYGIILNDFKLPKRKYDHNFTNVLVLLPPGYPDIPPDMFYCNPEIKQFQFHELPHCANVFVEFNGKRWQRWSRHNFEWRVGKDGIWTMIRRIEHAFREL